MHSSAAEVHQRGAAGGGYAFFSRNLDNSLNHDETDIIWWSSDRRCSPIPFASQVGMHEVTGRLQKSTRNLVRTDEPVC